MMGNLEVVQLLVTKFGANIHARLHAYNSNKVIDSAVFSMNVDLVRWLLDQGASPNVEETFSSCLSTAAMYGTLEMVKLLVERGAIVNPRVGLGTPLDAATCAPARPEIFEYLKSSGAKHGWELRGLSEPPTTQSPCSQPDEGSVEYHFRRNNFSANPITRELIGPGWPITIHLLTREEDVLLLDGVADPSRLQRCWPAGLPQHSSAGLRPVCRFIDFDAPMCTVKTTRIRGSSAR